VAAVLAHSGIGETRSGQVAQAERMIKVAEGEQTGVGGDPRTLEHKPWLRIEGDLASGPVCFTAALPMSASACGSHL
jgi:hypothetical protein